MAREDYEPKEFYSAVPPPNYSYSQYVRDSKDVAAGVGSVVGSMARGYQNQRTSRSRWLQFLASVFPFVNRGRRSNAELARKFYDSERARHFPAVEVPVFDLPERDILGPDGNPLDIDDRSTVTVKLTPQFRFNLPHYEPNWFEEALEPSRKQMETENAPDSAIVDTVARVAKEVENAGRAAMQETVERDPKSMGWARVEGNENVGSCAFCAMLISRGPVYDYASGAGLKSNDVSIAEVERANAANDYEALREITNYWHPNCDCKVVPVFDEYDWPGIDQFEAMEQLWADVMEASKERIRKDAERKRQGLLPKDYNPMLQAFRRALERGDLPKGIRRPKNL